MNIGLYTAISKPFKSFRGGGYWIWKPYFVKKVMDAIADDDILIYCDAGCILNHQGKDRFDECVRYCRLQKQEPLISCYFKRNSNILNEKLLSISILMIRLYIQARYTLLCYKKKCPHTVFLVNEWYHTAVNRPDLFSDEITLEQHPNFLDHRHYPSIFSLIRKKYGANIILDETGYFNSDLWFKYPLWARRLKDEYYL